MIGGQFRRHSTLVVLASLLDVLPTQAVAVSLLEVGELTCQASTGFDPAEAPSLICDFRAIDSPPEVYSALIKDHDIGAEIDGILVWTVRAKRAPDHSGSLAGDYIRSPAGSLVGGRQKAFTFEPAANLDGTISDSAAAAIKRMSVVPSN